ncbi:MAG: hypothetical protein IRY99_26465, partial [Isosphaeraceae bacterium]|nr:hypothetical protein [Isosphaeraceae bacterium]
MGEPVSSGRPYPRWAAFLLLFGLYLSFHGYHSRDGDQAYRLPLLLHRQDPTLYADDPFVRAFETFNPHEGYLALLDAASRLVGLSAALAGIYAATFALTCLGVDRLARAIWPEANPRVGVIAVGLLLLAKAGNIGTNHLFEPLLLDRLIALALGWVALASLVAHPGEARLLAPLLIAAASAIHPSLGLQLGLLLGGLWGIGCLIPGAFGGSRRVAFHGLALLLVALAPQLATIGSQGAVLLEGLPPEEMRLLSAWVQSPQHMLPHLWRLPQWLAWACYPVLAVLSLWESRTETPWPPARTRLVIALGGTLGGLGLAWVAIEILGDLKCTLFQPFRMATVARGLCLTALARRLQALWE